MKSIAFDAASSSSTTGGSPFTWNHTCTGTDRILVVALYNSAGDTVTGVTYNGVAMTEVAKSVGAGGGENYLYILVAPATGSNAISVTKSSGNMTGAASSYTNARQTSQPDNSTTNSSGASTTYAETLTPTMIGTWHVSGVFGSAANAISAGANTTVNVHLEDGAVGRSIAVGDNHAAITPAAANTLNFAATSMSWSSIGISIAPAPDVYTLTAAQGTLTLTGTATALYRVYNMVAAAGSYALTGFAAALTVTRTWINQSANTTSLSNQSKNATTWNNQSENSTSFTNQNRS